MTPPTGPAPQVTDGPPTAPLGPPRTPHGEAPHAEAPPADGGPAATNRFLARAALVTGVLAVAGALLGLGRDQTLAHLFGAGLDTDAFLVAWTVPEFAATLLIEDGMAFVLVPAFSVALARRARGQGQVEGQGQGGQLADPVREFVARSLPRLALALAALTVLLVAGAPLLVRLLAPGLPDPELAVDCTRIIATCAFSFGLAGYASAALRAHRRFLAPATIYVAYNIGIITTMFVLGGRWGVRSAAIGVAIGGCLMVAAQAPSLWRELRGRRRAPAAPDTAGEEPSARPEPVPVTGRRITGMVLISTVLLFALCRQCQVLIERFLGSSLPAGAISHLNYAQKVAQMPMVLSLMLCTVTFPVVAQALADGDTERARIRVERDIALAARTVLLGTAAVVACAPQLIHLLFQRGEFTAADTAATAGVMRVYALGLLGHTLVGALSRTYFSAGRPTWYPTAAMAVGIVVTGGVGVWAVGPWGVRGIAAANALGITVAAVLLLAGTGARTVPLHRLRVLAGLVRPVTAALCATGAGLLCTVRIADPLLAVVAGAAAVAAVFALVLVLPVPGTRTPALSSLARRTPGLRSLGRKRAHVR
ncbi:murein biosynthesis integral membrane protein MurJ [Streptomyces sp. NPDC091292]|uniref:murein biosynthesis integral membrane protein MurJ n=1 Tax=Streptomyces sp. NPDC091292 TaxID=3365991 RepID=UPI00380A8B5C